MDLIPFKEVPVSFIRKTLTNHQKEYIQIKYHIKLALEECEGTKIDLYEDLSEELPLSFHTIRKLAEAI